MSKKVKKVKKIDLIAATRPNFMKIGPLLKVLENEDWCKVRLIHTGQHYDRNMSDVFFEELAIRSPDINLNIGGGTHAEQKGKTMMAYEKLILKDKPDMTIVVGDVNATLACSLAAKKVHVLVGHVEAGLRSGDMKMPEEINRILTDHISDMLWTTSDKASKNLEREGINKSKIHFVGDIMLDAYENLNELIEKRDTYKKYSDKNDFVVVTFHRPRNVDTKKRLIELVDTLSNLADKVTTVFPIHPRTESNLKRDKLWENIRSIDNLHLVPPLGYLDFMNLVTNSKFVVSDSGSVQTETTYLNIPCITVRDTTERPVTITKGTVVLAEMHEVGGHVESILKGKWKQSKRIDGWDGQTSIRIGSTLKTFLS